MKKNIFRLINSWFNIQINLDYEETKSQSFKIIEELKKTNWHHGYKKYLAQVMLFEPRQVFLKNFLCAIGLVAIIPLVFIISMLKHSVSINTGGNLYVIADHPLLRLLSDRHAKLLGLKNYHCVNNYSLGMAVDGHVLKYFLKLLQEHPYIIWHPYLMTLIIVKLCRYNAFIVKYDPHRIYSYNERSFVGPFVTEYLESRGIEHNLIMHGYRTYNVKDAFCHYTKMYVFGPYFKEMFENLYANTREYHCIGHPSVNDIVVPKTSSSNYNNSVLLVLQPPNVLPLEEISIFQKLLFSASKEYRLVVKPRAGSENWVAGHYPDLLEENENNTSVLAKYQIYVGKHSTFLMEAWALGKKVILLGNNSLPQDLVDGPNVLRLVLEGNQRSSEKSQLELFLQTPVQVDWQRIHYIFSKEPSPTTTHRNPY